MISWPFVAIDPGDAHVGIARFTASIGPPYRVPDCLDQSSSGDLRLVECVTLSPRDAISWLETRVCRFRAVVLEEYRLYPWLAREQGFSDFPTAQLVGVVKYLAARVDVPVYMQSAKDNLKDGRSQALRHGFSMVDRQLGHGKYTYRGPDFNLPGPPHRRDAASHGCRFAYLDSSSPLVKEQPHDASRRPVRRSAR